MKKTLRPPTAEDLKKFAKGGALVGVAIWTVLYAALGVMVVTMGGWPLVVWPFTVFLWVRHLAAIGKAYKSIVEPPKKWEQNVTVNITSELSSEEIAAAATRAVDDQRMWSLLSR
jgi:hypothetical protein